MSEFTAAPDQIRERRTKASVTLRSPARLIVWMPRMPLPSAGTMRRSSSSAKSSSVRRVTRFNALFHWAVPPGREIEAGGEIGGLTSTHYSLMGYCTRAADIALTMAPEIASRLKAEGADAVLVVPV